MLAKIAQWLGTLMAPIINVLHDKWQQAKKVKQVGGGREEVIDDIKRKASGDSSDDPPA